MELFENNKDDFLLYLESAIINKTVELECIFGMKQANNPINKNIFLDLMERCKQSYHTIEETTNLDIRIDFRNNISNIRCTVDGLDSIKKYCREDSLDNIDPEYVTFLQKQYYKDGSIPDKKYSTLQDENYNVRLNLKSEKPLMKDHRFVIQFLDDFKNKRKHFRYKKRVSFLTKDKLFKIDLTVVKSTRWFKGKYDFQKSFKNANILKNREEYELEIEYLGWKKKVGIEEIDELYNHFNNFYISTHSMDVIGNIYDPLNLGIKIFDTLSSDMLSRSSNDPKQFIPEPFLYQPTEVDESGINPFHYSDLNQFNPEDTRYTENIVVEDSEITKEYQGLIGKYVKIKNEYFDQINTDTKLKGSLEEYYARGVNILILKDVIEYKNHGTDAIIEFIEPMGEYKELRVPIKYIYNIPTFEQTIYNEYEDDTSMKNQTTSGRIPNEENKKKITDNLLKRVSGIFEGHINDLTKLIYKTDNIISYKLKNDIIRKYKQFTDQSTKPYHFTFVAPQPVTLTIDYLKVNNPRTILKDYAVTEKADGERYQMLIVDHRGYLINSKKDVIDMNLYFDDYENGWIFDGEYITRDKDHNPIQLFMVFDIYYDEVLKKKITPQPIHTYPFISRDSSDISRYNRINTFFNGLKFRKYNKKNESIILNKKDYEFGLLTKRDDDSNIDNYKYSEDIKGIFKASEMILKREREGYYEYRIDGLIYLPVRYSVKGSIEGLQSKNINGTWDYNFKWKPPEENTIDFMVKVQKTVENSKVIDKISPMFELENGIKMVNEYKQLELYVGYDTLEDENIDYCMHILTGTIKKKKEENERIKIFNHHSKDVEKYNTTNIKLNNGKMICLNMDKEEIKDGDLVEMRFNKDGDNSCYWEPLRLRNDKKNPQYFTVANNVWTTILDPVTFNMITGDYDIESSVEGENEKDGKYYVNDNDMNLYESNKLRKLHNYIKSKLISGICSTFKKPIKIMDLSFGQGGDSQKYINDKIRCSVFMGIDISSNISEACRRFYSVNKNTKGVLIRADTSKNIRNGECSNIEGITEKERIHTETMISIM